MTPDNISEESRYTEVSHSNSAVVNIGILHSTPSHTRQKYNHSSYGLHGAHNLPVDDIDYVDQVADPNHDTGIPLDIDPPAGFEPLPVPSTSTSSDYTHDNSNSTTEVRNGIAQIHDDDRPHTNGGIRPQQHFLPSTSNTSTLHSHSSSSSRANTESTSSETNIERTSTAVTSQTDNAKESQPIASSSRLFSGINSAMSRISRAFTNTSPKHLISMMSTDRCLQDDVPQFAFGHKRSLEKTWKLMDKVVKCCQRPRMNLNNSPPFILEILPEMYQHLKLIHSAYGSGRLYPQNDSEYSQIFLQNLQNRCKQTLKLFKDAKEEMFDEESDYRHKLTRNTLVFNHILSELKAIFPNGKFVEDKYLITKKESAGEFWRNSFGTSVLVDWRTFYHALQQVHNIDSSFFSLNALKQTIDLTCDEYISIFEFDVFTRLFQPWSTLLRNWQILAVTHPGYKAFLTYDELKARLQKHIDKPGSYVFRLSCTRLGQWAIGYVTHDRQILQTIVQNISLSQALTETKFYLYPDGRDVDPSLSVLCSGMAGDERNVTVTEEQYEIYCGVGNSFQLCKICFENDKDIRVEPCNHLLCTSCLLAWQESKGNPSGCPYCRTEIKETVQITMDLPRKSSAG